MCRSCSGCASQPHAAACTHGARRPAGWSSTRPQRRSKCSTKWIRRSPSTVWRAVKRWITSLRTDSERYRAPLGVRPRRCRGTRGRSGIARLQASARAAVLCRQAPRPEHALPDTAWFPDDGYRALQGDELQFLLFPVARPELFDACAQRRSRARARDPGQTRRSRLEPDLGRISPEWTRARRAARSLARARSPRRLRRHARQRMHRAWSARARAAHRRALLRRRNSGRLSTCHAAVGCAEPSRRDLTAARLHAPDSRRDAPAGGRPKLPHASTLSSALDQRYRSRCAEIRAASC